MANGGKMKTDITRGIPSCEWPDAQKPAIFRNCCDKDGRPDKNRERRAAENRIQTITNQLNCPHGLTNKERRALASEHELLERMFGLGRFSPAPVAELDERKEKATQKKLRFAKRDQTNLQKSDIRV
jgi:hypothetical protein